LAPKKSWGEKSGHEHFDLQRVEILTDLTSNWRPRAIADHPLALQHRQLSVDSQGIEIGKLQTQFLKINRGARGGGRVVLRRRFVVSEQISSGSSFGRRIAGFLARNCSQD
jgi:hypothetical protein